jgi:hypothetical protein
VGTEVPKEESYPKLCRDEVVQTAQRCIAGDERKEREASKGNQLFIGIEYDPSP